MTQIDQAWGAGPSARYEDLAERFRPIFARIRETAVERDLNRGLPHGEIGWLKDAGFSTLRVAEADGGLGVTLPEFFALLIELSEADPNVTNALRSHFGFTEDILVSSNLDWQRKWLDRIANRETIGSGFSEVGDNKLGAYSTRLTTQEDGYLLNGRKYYTTGSLYADWINLGAANEAGAPLGALVPRNAQGVEVLDDWDGFGQSLSASGTAVFSDVTIDADLIAPAGGRFKYANGFFQLIHLATLAGIGRAAAKDVARLVAERTRVYGHGNADRVSQDPQILQVVGRVHGAAYSAGAIVLKAAEALQRAHDAHGSSDAEFENRINAIAELEVSQSVTVISNLILDATTLLFDALGASASKRGHGLDRYWRNARTITSHNPRIYRDRIVGDFAVSGTIPTAKLGVGQAS
jgi:alkylation response protein AidB-like acyl-CoA dehydrogenase